jgi:acyl carrier protein
MTQEQIFSKVAELIAANNEVAVTDITMDSTFEDLNMDSLDGLTLVNELETAFEISIPNGEAMQIRSVRQTVESLEKIFILSAAS